MPKFNLTDEGSAASLELDSDTLRFDRLVLEICGGGMTEASTAMAMETRRELMQLPVGGKKTVQYRRGELTFERLTL